MGFLRSVFNALLILHLIGFISFRSGDLFYILVSQQCAIASCLLVLTMYMFKLRSAQTFLLVIALACFVYYVVDTYGSVGVAMRDLSGTVAVVTGANSGVGLQTARELAAMNATVVLGCRSKAKCAEAASDIQGSVFVTENSLDVGSLASVHKFAKEVQNKFGAPSILVNNAGFAGSEGKLTSDELEMSFGSMHVGHFALTELFAKEKHSLRVVSVSSGTHHLCAFKKDKCLSKYFFDSGHREPYHSEWQYARAKLANVMHAQELSKRHSHVSAIAVDLGWVDTKIQNFKIEGSFALLGWMRHVTRGAAPITHAAVAPDEQIAKGDLMDMWLHVWPAFELERRLGLKESDDDTLATRLWDLSAKLVGEKMSLD
eukprot:TRINITY_DN24318_c0_g1_i1.p1 TRINITY_DN24318_c0_g1~~TRINITY_DN24318_c0_g1_i1.p1  ORF type:complete len:373 (-),score=46.72 TRINITY_DN24318_c0_g1_i1:101-1219(-)